MATFTDFSLFAIIAPIFMFLLVFAVVYGFLNMIKIFKGTSWANGIHAIIALTAAAFAVGNIAVFTLIATLTPWFTVLIIFLFLAFFVIRMFSGDDDKLFAAVLKRPPVIWTLIVLFIIILIASLSSTFGQNLLEEQVSTTTTVDEDGNEIVVQQSGTTTGTGSGTVGRQVEQGSTATGDFSNNVLQTIVHPKVLGLILFMLIGFFTMLLIARNTQDPDNNN